MTSKEKQDASPPDENELTELERGFEAAVDDGPAVSESKQEPEADENAEHADVEADESAGKEEDPEEHRRRSDAGRIRALQRKVEELRKQIESGTPKQSEEAVAEALDIIESSEDDPEWQRLREEYPELAGPLEKRVAALSRHLAEIKKKNDELTGLLKTMQVERAAVENIERLEKLVPGWQKAIDADPDAFLEWVNGQPRYVQETVARNLEVIVDPESTADILKRYLEHRNGASAPRKSSVQPNDAVRTARAKGSVAPKGSAMPAASGPPDDVEAAFDYWDRVLSR